MKRAPFWRATLTVLAILAATLPATGAHARSPEELLKRGVFLISRARFDDSIKALEQARGRTSDAELLGRIHLYLGINHSILGQEARSDQEFRKALSYNPELQLDPKRIKASIVDRFNSIRDSLPGELAVDADVAGAEVSVDGERAGTTPLRTKLTPGVYTVVVRHPSTGAVHKERVTVARGKTASVSARLVVVDKPRPTKRKRIWTWVAAGTAAVSLGVAIGLGLSAQSDHKEYRDEEKVTTYDEAKVLESSGKSKALGSSIMFGVAGAAAATSVVLFFLEGRGGERRAASVSVVPGPSPAVVFSGRF